MFDGVFDVFKSNYTRGNKYRNWKICKYINMLKLLHIS